MSFPSNHLNSLNTVVIKENYSSTSAENGHYVDLAIGKSNETQFARKQVTWFKADPEIAVYPDETEACTHTSEQEPL